MQSLSEAQREALKKLFDPASVAIVGASSDPRKLSGRTTGYLRRLGFKGQVFPIHPAEKQLDGFPCFRSLAEIDAAIDVLVIARPAEEAPGIVDEALAKGIR